MPGSGAGFQGAQFTGPGCCSITHQRPAAGPPPSGRGPHGAVEVVVEGLVVGVALAQEAQLALGRVLEPVDRKPMG
jgi:hypothetical protein